MGFAFFEPTAKVSEVLPPRNAPDMSDRNQPPHSNTTPLLRLGGRLQAFIVLIALNALASVQLLGNPADKTYTLGIFTDNYPYSFVNDEGKLDGFAYELTLALEQTMGLHFQRISGTTPEINTAMDAGMLDLLQTLAASKDREDRYDFSKPYLPMVQSILFRKGDTRIKSINDLKGKRVLVHHNSLGEAFLRANNLSECISYVPSVEIGLRNLHNGAGDAVIATRLTAISTAIRLGLDNIDRKAVPLPSMTVAYSYALRKDQAELLLTLDEGLAILHDNGEFNRIYQKWFGKIDRGGYSAEEIMAAISAGLGLALLISLWAFLRQRKLQTALSEQAVALRDSEERYRGIFEFSQEGLILLSAPPALALAQCNEAAKKIFRLQLNPLPETPLSVALPDEVAHQLTQAITEATNSQNSPFFELELNFDFNSTWVRGSATVLGENILLVLTDITEAQLAEQRLQKSEQQLRQTQKLEAIGTLSSGIAHDFNNILTGIIGNAELACFDIPEDHPSYLCLTELLKSSNRARDLVRQILTFSRKSPSKREPLFCTTIVEEALGLIRATAPASIEIRHLPNPAAPKIEADPTQLHQIIMNLCTNALHAMRGKNGLLEITEEVVSISPEMIAMHPQLKPGNFVRLSIKDSGPGMSSDVMRRIFEPFFTTKGPGEGTGLGLSVVHGIVESHGGAITVYSQLGQGTVFRIHFPTTNGEARDLNPVTAEIPTGKGQRILFVDDEPAIVRIAEPLLRRLGYNCLCFTRPQEANLAFAENPGSFDLLLSDLSMPGMSGLDLAKCVRMLRPDLPVILASGYIGENETNAAAKERVQTILLKPLSFASLAHALDKELNQAPNADTPPRA